MNAETKVKAASFPAALVMALNELEGVTKGKVNPAFKSKYADLASVLDAVRPVFAKHDLAVTQETSPSEEGVIVETVVLHASGEERRFGKLFVPANKRDAQGAGSALTYARRYSLMTAFGVPAEDDDGNLASRPSTQPRADPVEPAKPITGEQRDIIQTLAPGAGKTVQGICESYKVAALTDLTEAQGKAVIARLQELAKAPVQ